MTNRRQVEGHDVANPSAHPPTLSALEESREVPGGFGSPATSHSSIKTALRSPAMGSYIKAKMRASPKLPKVIATLSPRMATTSRPPGTEGAIAKFSWEDPQAESTPRSGTSTSEPKPPAFMQRSTLPWVSDPSAQQALARTNERLLRWER